MRQVRTDLLVSNSRKVFVLIECGVAVLLVCDYYCVHIGVAVVGDFLVKTHCRASWSLFVISGVEIFCLSLFFPISRVSS